MGGGGGLAVMTDLAGSFRALVFRFQRTNIFYPLLKKRFSIVGSLRYLEVAFEFRILCLKGHLLFYSSQYPQ